MNSETFKNNPYESIEDMTEEEIEAMTDSLVREITADLANHPLDVHHPLWQRMRDAYKWLAPTKTEEEHVQMLLEFFQTDGHVSIGLQQAMLEGLAYANSIPNEEHKNEK